MPFLQARQEFDPSCPSGGTWYSCGAGVQFVGCCTSDPCNENGCSAGNLRAASFNASAYGSFPDLECDSGQFYTCTGTDPPFLGCCRENACRASGLTGCPQVSLTGAHLPNNAAKASAWLPTGGPSSTETSSASATNSASSDSSSTSTAAIAGGVVGAVVVIFFVIGALIWRRRRNAKKKKKESLAELSGRDRDPVSELSATNPSSGGGKGHHSSPLHPPRYSAITGSPNNWAAVELDGYPRKPAPNTPSELGADSPTVELPGEDAVHELEGSTIAGSTPRSQGTHATTTHSRGSSWSSATTTTTTNEKKERRLTPRGLAISGLHPHGRLSPRTSPRSPNFPPQGRGAGEEQDGESERSEGGVSSLPSTPRSAYGRGEGTGYSEVSRLSPMFPPRIEEEEGGGAWERRRGGGGGGSGERDV